MIRTFCDRCGVDLTPKRKTLAEVIGKALCGISDTITFALSNDQTPNYVVKRKDDVPVALCESCENAFKEFMSSAAKKNELTVVEDQKKVK